MKKESILKRLQSKGFKVVHTFEGNYIATKGQQSYKAGSLNQLYKLIF